MSSEQSRQTETVCQDNPFENSQMNQQERFYRVYADIGELLLAIMTGAAFLALSRRLSLLCHGIWIPSSGTCDTHAAAAMLDLSEQRMDIQLRERHVPRAKPGQRTLVRVADLAGEFNAPSDPLQPVAMPKRRGKGAAPVKRKK